MADRGTAALDELERQVKSTWNDELKNAYAKLGAREAIEAYALRYRAIAEAEAARATCARGTAAGPGE